MTMMPNSRSRCLMALFVTARLTSLGVLLYVCLRAALVGGGNVASDVIATALLLAICAAAAFLFNDAFDAQADAVFNRHRPVAQGECSPRAAGAASLILVFFAVIAAAWVGGRDLMLAMAVIGVCGIAYSPIARRFGIAKGVLACGLCLWPVALVTRAAGAHVPWRWYLAAALFLFGRELLMDVRDRLTDAQAGRRTLPHLLGPATAAVIGWGLVATGVLVLPSGGHVAGLRDIVVYATVLVGGLLWKVDSELSTGALRLTMIAAVEYIAMQ